MQILWWISQASNTKLVLTPTLSSTACLQLHLPVKVHAIPLSLPRPMHLRLAWNCPTHPRTEKSQPCPTVRCTAKGTVKHSNRASQRPNPLGSSPWPCSWRCWTHALLLNQALQEACPEPELAPHGSEKICCWCSNPAEHLLIGPIWDAPYTLHTYGYMKGAGLLSCPVVARGSLLSVLAHWSHSASQGCNQPIPPLMFSVNRCI